MNIRKPSRTTARQGPAPYVVAHRQPKHEPGSHLPCGARTAAYQSLHPLGSAMNWRWSSLGIGLWLASLFVPTLPVKGSAAFLGYELLGESSMMIVFVPFVLFFPVHVLAWFSNLAVIFEILFTPFHMTRPRASIPSLKYLALLVVADIYVGLSSAASGKDVPYLNGILHLPGYYLWLASMICLFLSRFFGVLTTKQTKSMDEQQPSTQK
jgi:hypothetical protein